MARVAWARAANERVAKRRRGLGVSAHAIGAADNLGQDGLEKRDNMQVTPFSHDIRVLTCQVCGAPIEATLTGGQIKCAYCGTSHHIVERNEQIDRERARIGLGAAISESERHAQLRAQQSGELHLPQSLHVWLQPDGSLEPRFATDALNDWQAQRQQIATGSKAFTVAERLFYLTLLLAAHVEPRRARAMLETAAELLVDERHRHVVRCMLGRLAAQNGDVEGAQAWLETCNPRPTDLTMDTAYRYAAATLAVAQSDLARVAELLGTRDGDVPLAPRDAFGCELLRAHAFEQAGNFEAAVNELNRLAMSRGEDGLVRQLAAFLPLTLCPQSHPERQRRMATQRDQAVLEAAIDKRSKLRTGLMAVVELMGSLPLYAFALVILLAPIRCISDADPLLGIYGLPLCPNVCQGCYGPTRTITRWSHFGGKHSTNGAEYYCNGPSQKVDRLSDERLEDLASSLGAQQLGFLAAFGASYLILLGMLVMGLPIAGLSRHRKNAAYAQELEREIRLCSERLGQEPPTFTFDSNSVVVVRELRFFAISVVVACSLILFSLAV
jgi:hypothetical protein